MCFTMHMFFCPEQQQQQQTLVAKKTSRSLDHFGSVSNSYQSLTNFPGLLHAANDQTVDFERVWEHCYM